MNVSKTELTALLKQVFEGLGFACGEHESAADMIVWAQMSGLGGLQELGCALPYLVAQRQPLQCLCDDEAHATVDAGGSSCLNIADVAINLAYVKALARESSTVTVLNCYNRKLLSKAIVDCGRRGMACMMHWRDANDPLIEHVLRMAPEDGSNIMPRYTLNRVQVQGNIAEAHRQSLFIHCSTQWLQQKEYQSSVLSQRLEELNVIEPETLRDNYHFSLNRGMSMENDLWRRLQELALVVLVESSEQSRMGAGA
jgi:hypothetical protein